MQTTGVRWAAGAAALAAVVLGLSGCELCEDLNCDGGGIGVGNFSFTRGLVFVTAGAANVGGADARDYSVTGVFTNDGAYRDPSVGPGGDSLVYASQDGNALYRVPTAGGVASVLANQDPTFRNLRQPVFTPDGLFVLFTYDSGGRSGIGRVSADGTGGIVPLSPSGAVSYSSPSFDRSGRLLAVSGTSGNPTSLRYLDPNTGSPNEVASGLGNALAVANRAQLSPDGTRVAFDGRISSGATRLFVLDLASGTTEQLDVGAGNQTYPTWTGNAELAFGSDEGGADQIYVVPAAGGSPTLIIPSARQPSFGPL